MTPAPLPERLKRRRQIYLPVLLTIIDVLAIVLGLVLAYGIRFHSSLMSVTKGYDSSDYQTLLPVATLVLLVAFYFSHLYRRNEKIWGWRVAGRIIKGCVLAVAMFVTLLFFFRSLTRNPLARPMIPLTLVTVPLFVMLLRWMVHRNLIVAGQRSGRGLARALVIGIGPSAMGIVRSIRRHPEFGWTIVGLLSPDAQDVGKNHEDLEILGSFQELSGVLSREKIEAVFVAQPDCRHEMLGDILIECQKRMVDVKVLPDATELLFSQVSVEEVDGIPFLGLRDTPLQGWNVVLKRLLDIVVSGLLLTLASPVLAVVAWLVRRGSPGPVFYGQERIGADGGHFVILKFRTMWVDAEKRTGPVFSTPDDPRQTPIGRILRQMHLDELPQLINVFRGDMSLVGPRPERPHFVEQFREEIPGYMARHRIKCGMTGWAQVSGQTGFEGTISDRLKYDLYYVENWSPLFDVKVLLLTIVWLLRRLRQMATLPANHPSLRRPRDLSSARLEPEPAPVKFTPPANERTGTD